MYEGEQKMSKKLLCLILSICMVVALIPASAAADTLHVIDISKGRITVTAGTDGKTLYTQGSDTYEAAPGEQVVITGTINSGSNIGICVTDADAAMVFRNLTITATVECVCLKGKSNVKVMLEGNNTFNGDNGIVIESNSGLTIDSNESVDGTSLDSELRAKLTEHRKIDSYSSVKYEGTLNAKVIKGGGNLHIEGGNIQLQGEVRFNNGKSYLNGIYDLSTLDISGGNVQIMLDKSYEGYRTANKINITGGHIFIKNSRTQNKARADALAGDIQIGTAGGTDSDLYMYVSNGNMAGAAIGGSGKRVKIYSGTVIAETDTSDGTAIGVGYTVSNFEVYIDILGGDVTAKGPHVVIGGRGQGSGKKQATGNSYVKISGGKVNATGIFGILNNGGTANQNNISIEFSGDAAVNVNGKVYSPKKNIITKDNAAVTASGGFNQTVEVSNSAKISFGMNSNQYAINTKSIVKSDDPLVVRYAQSNSTRKNPIIVFPKKAAVPEGEKVITLAEVSAQGTSAAYDIDTTDSQKPFAVARYTDDYTSSLLQKKEEAGYCKFTLKPEAEAESGTARPVNLNLESYKPAVTYEQISGKDSTKNNDPLLVVGTVTGKDGLRPQGMLYYMFSGTLDDDKLNEFIKGASTQEFGESITRVMDTAETPFDETKASFPSSLVVPYNGVSDLNKADITFDTESEANRSRYNGSEWIDIPEELGKLIVFSSLGKDVVSYYMDSDFTIPADEDTALYKVNRTYEYTSLVEMPNLPYGYFHRPTRLSDLLNGTYSYDMEYSDVEVFIRKDASEPFAKADGYNTGNVGPIVSDKDYGNVAAKMADIKKAILDNINDGDTTNDFWNQADSSFGLYITYEYIAPNVCLSRYVKKSNDTTSYEAAFSPAKLLTPGIAAIVPEYLVYKKKAGSDTWEKVTPNSDGEYEVEYYDSIKLAVKDPDGAFTVGKYEYKVQNDAITFGDPTGETGWNLVKEYDAGLTSNLSGAKTVIDIVRQYDGTYSQSNQSLTIKINGKVDAAVPMITLADEALHIKNDADLKVTASAEVSDGGTLTYQWYEVYDDGTRSELVGQTSNVLTIPAGDIDSISSGSVKTYSLEVTNTNDSVNGEKTAKSSKDIEIKFIEHGDLDFTLQKNVATSPELTYKVGETPEIFQAVVTDEGPGEGTFIYKWYRSDGPDRNPETDTEVTGMPGQEDTYIDDLSEEGTFYYYAEVTKKALVIDNDGNLVEKTITKYTDPVKVVVKKASGGGGLSSYEHPTIITDEGSGYELSDLGTSVKIEVLEGYELESVTKNGEDVGKVTSLDGLVTGDVVVVTTKKSDTEPVPEPEEPGKDNKPDKPQKPSKDIEGLPPKKEDNTGIPKTGDADSLLLYLLAMIGAAGAAGALCKRKKS